MEIPRYLLRHTVTVEPQTGEGGLGDTYGPPVPISCFRDDRRRLVRDSTGAQVVSEVTLITRLAYAGSFPPDSKVTLDDGRVVYVQQVSRRSDSGMGGWQHLEVVC